MKKWWLIVVVLFLARTASPWGKHTKTHAKIEAAHKELCAQNKQQYSRLVKIIKDLETIDKTLSDAIMAVFMATTLQMENNALLRQKCIKSITISNELIEINGVPETIDLYTYTAGGKIARKVIQQEQKILVCFEKMLSTTSYVACDKTDGFREILSNEIENLPKKELYQGIITQIDAFIQKQTSDNPEIAESLLYFADKTFECLHEIIHLVSPENYTQTIETAIKQALIDIKEEREESEKIALLQKQIETEWLNARRLFEALERANKQNYNKKIAQNLQVKYEKLQQITLKMNEKSSSLLSQDLEDLKSMSESLVASSLTKLSKNLKALDQRDLLEKKDAIRKTIYKSNALMNKYLERLKTTPRKYNVYLNAKNEYNRRTGSLRTKVRNATTMDQLKPLKKLAKEYLKEAEVAAFQI